MSLITACETLLVLIGLFPVIESHTETAPSLRIDKAFPALLDYSLALDFANMDPTDHTHVPYVIILVRALEEWKKLVSIFPSLQKTLDLIIVLARWKTTSNLRREESLQRGRSCHEIQVR